MGKSDSIINTNYSNYIQFKCITKFSILLGELNYAIIKKTTKYIINYYIRNNS